MEAPKRSGKLIRMVGLTLEAQGIVAPSGALCIVESPGGKPLEAEVVGFNDRTTYLMPFGEPVGIGPGAAVRVAGACDRRDREPAGRKGRSGMSR